MTGPLAGVRVIELLGIGPGPFCGMLLGDLGAEVIRVERPALPPAGSGPSTVAADVPLNLVGDFGGGGMLLALGVVSAPLSARGTGLGQVVDAAIVDGTATLLAMMHAFTATGRWQDRPGVNFLDGSERHQRTAEVRRAENRLQR